MGKRALIMAGKLLQDHEYIYPYYRLPEDGYEVDVAVRGKETVLGSIGVKIVPTKDIPELKVEDYDILVLPGGAKAMEYMRQDEEILKFIADFHAAGKEPPLLAAEYSPGFPTVPLEFHEHQRPLTCQEKTNRYLHSLPYGGHQMSIPGFV